MGRGHLHVTVGVLKTYSLTAIPVRLSLIRTLIVVQYGLECIQWLACALEISSHVFCAIPG